MSRRGALKSGTVICHEVAELRDGASSQDGEAEGDEAVDRLLALATGNLAQRNALAVLRLAAATVNEALIVVIASRESGAAELRATRTDEHRSCVRLLSDHRLRWCRSP